MGTRNATPQAGDILSSCATPFPGSRICTLVTLGKNGLLYAPSDADVAHLEASFIGPDLRDLDNSLLRTGGNEEEERKALLERMRAHDLILNRIENQQSIDTPGGEFHTATNIGEDKICGDSDNQVTSFGFESSARKEANQTQEGYFDPGGDRDFVAEDDEDDADLLCDFAPGALQADGSVGLMDSEGTHVLLPPTPAPRAQSSYKMTRRPTALQRRAMILGRAQFARQRQEAHVLSRQFDLNGSGWDDREQCLSDNWHPTDSSDSSITSLRQQYHQVFGKETSSNNRQWLLKRLASSHFGNNSGGEIDLSAGDNSGNGTGSNLEEYTGSDEIAATHHYNSIGNGWENMFAKHSGTGCTGRKQAVNKTHGTEKLVTNLSELSPVAVTLQVPGYDLQAKTRGNHQSSKRGRNTNSHSAEGGTAKTGGSSAGKKSKKCKLPELGDHSASEQPVKSCKNSHQVPQRKLFTSRKISGGDRRGNVGASGRRSKHHNPWALEEAVALVDGVAKCGGGKWADIKKLGYQAIEHRTAVDLKDKWRNLLRIAMLPHQPLKTAGDKKREIPADLLTRVRDLASKQGKKAAQDGRVRSGSH